MATDKLKKLDNGQRVLVQNLFYFDLPGLQQFPTIIHDKFKKMKPLTGVSRAFKQYNSRFFNLNMCERTLFYTPKDKFTYDDITFLPLEEITSIVDKPHYYISDQGLEGRDFFGITIYMNDRYIILTLQQQSIYIRWLNYFELIRWKHNGESILKREKTTYRTDFKILIPDIKIPKMELGADDSSRNQQQPQTPNLQYQSSSRAQSSSITQPNQLKGRATSQSDVQRQIPNINDPIIQNQSKALKNQIQMALEEAESAKQLKQPLVDSNLPHVNQNKEQSQSRQESPQNTIEFQPLKSKQEEQPHLKQPLPPKSPLKAIRQPEKRVDTQPTQQKIQNPIVPQPLLQPQQFEIEQNQGSPQKKEQAKDLPVYQLLETLKEKQLASSTINKTRPQSSSLAKQPLTATFQKETFFGDFNPPKAEKKELQPEPVENIIHLNKSKVVNANETPKKDSYYVPLPQRLGSSSHRKTYRKPSTGNSVNLSINKATNKQPVNIWQEQDNEGNIIIRPQIMKSNFTSQITNEEIENTQPKQIESKPKQTLLNDEDDFNEQEFLNQLLGIENKNNKSIPEIHQEQLQLSRLPIAQSIVQELLVLSPPPPPPPPMKQQQGFFFNQSLYTENYDLEMSKSGIGFKIIEIEEKPQEKKTNYIDWDDDI